MEKTIKECAIILAKEFMDVDCGAQRVYWAPHDEDIRLVEISNSVSDIGEVLPFRFCAFPPDIPYKNLVVLMSPNDFDKAMNGEMDWIPEFFSNIELIMDWNLYSELNEN